jgi:putative hydrolase of HD superfamily
MDHICEFLYEMGHLKRIQHEGWKFLGDKTPESVAEHSLRAAQLGFILATCEGYHNPEEVCAMLVFHDIGECRIGDIHKIAKAYIKANEEQAVHDQVRDMKDVGEKIFKLWAAVHHQTTTAGIIAKDADLLEMAMTAREYMEKGYKAAEEWIESITPKLKTTTAQDLLQHLRQCSPNQWWKQIKQRMSKP